MDWQVMRAVSLKRLKKTVPDGRCNKLFIGIVIGVAVVILALAASFLIWPDL